MEGPVNGVQRFAGEPETCRMNRVQIVEDLEDDIVGQIEQAFDFCLLFGLFGCLSVINAFRWDKLL